MISQKLLKFLLMLITVYSANIHKYLLLLSRITRYLYPIDNQMVLQEYSYHSKLLQRLVHQTSVVQIGSI